MEKVRCPICDREVRGGREDWPDHPFCSRRCRQIDLGRWLGEDYRIPRSTPTDEADADPPPTP